MSSNYRNASSVDALRARALYILLTVLVGLWLTWDAAFYGLVLYAPWGDYWEHTAALTEWLRNFAAPANPHVADPSLSPRYMPWYWLLTYLGQLFGLDAVTLMGISSVANYVLVVVGLHLFLQSYFRDHWAPLIGFIVIFFFWGVSWNWSNLYHLRSFFYVAGFPSTFVFGLSLCCFALVLRLLRRDGSVIVMGVLLTILAALMFVAHPLTGVFAIVGCGLLALTESAESVAMRALTIAALLAGTLLAELWPYFSVWKLSLGLYGSGTEQWFAAGADMGPLERLRSGVWQHIFYNPKLLLVMFGPTLLGAPLCLWLLARREHRFIVLGAAAMAVPYLLHPLVEVPLAHRFILFVAFYLQLAIVWAVLQVIDAWNSRPRPAYARNLLLGTVALIACMLVFNIVLLGMEFQGKSLTPKNLEVVDKRAQLPEGMNVVELYTALTEPLADDAVVLTTPIDGWPLPTVKGKVVSLFHENPMLLDQQERFYRTSAFFEQPQMDVERATLIKQYMPSHMLLKGSPAHASLATWMARHAELLVSVGDYRMYKLRASATDGALDQEDPEAAAAEKQTGTAADPELVAPAEPATPSPGDPKSINSERSASQREPAARSPQPESAAQDATDAAAPRGSFGAPIAAPLITEPDPEQDLLVPEELGIVEPGDILDDTAETAPETGPEEGSFGAPIQDPVLDPERHGG